VITKLSHATLYVLDQDQALAFYTEKLGFEVRTDFSMEGGFRWLSVGPRTQPEVELVLYAARPSGLFDESSANHLRSVLEAGKMGGGVFETADCRATYEALSAKGVTFLQPPQDQPYGVEALFTDGCGNWFSLTEHR
jgi:catechol 2,3-dioxygenase-like lactoylglutathione lyase family enzyme